MNTNSKKAAADESLSDLRDAITATVLTRARDGALIIGSEQTGARDEWIFDFRALMLQPHWLNRYAELFWERYADRLPFQVGGVETAGIPLVAAIVMKGVERGTPVNGFYIRKSRKRMGLMKYIEGTLTDEPIVFVDDLLNSGQSLNKQIDILAREGKTVTDAFVMLTYRSDDAYSFLSEKHVRLTRLFTLTDFGIPLLRADNAAVPQESFEITWHYAAAHPSYHLVVQKSAPLCDGARVYLGCDDGVFRALNSETGSVVWEYKVGRHPEGKGILSSPILHEGTVYFGAYDGNTYALDAESGQLRWVNTEADWIGSSPDVAPECGMLFIGLEFGLFKKQGGIAAINLKTGKTIWTARHTSLTHGSPLYIPEESLVVIGSNNGILYAYDAATGQLQWSFATTGDIKTRAAYDAPRRAVVFASMNGVLYSVDARDGSARFARELGAGVYSTPLVDGDTVYVTSLDKCVYAIDCATGKDRWVFETSGRIFASPRISDDSLWVGSNDGRLYELDPHTGSLNRFFQVTERIVSPVCFSGERIIVPTVANEIYCIQKK